MKRTSVIWLFILSGSVLAFTGAGTSALSNGDCQSSPVLGIEQAPLGADDAEIIVTGASMFIPAAMYAHSTNDGDPYTANREGLDLVYNCMNYLIGTSGNVACMGEFDPSSISGLQTDFPGYEPLNQNFMEFVEENLNGDNPDLPGDHPYHCSYEFTQIDNSDPLINGGQPNYDLLMIGEQWTADYLFTRSEIINYLLCGGKIILGSSSELDPVAGDQLTFLPKSQIFMKRQLIDGLPLPPCDPSHPIADNIDDGQWGIQSEVVNVIFNYDLSYYHPVFANYSALGDGEAYLVVGGEQTSAVTETSWGAIKEGLSR
ncbi:MAG: hypothetical protein GF403_07045 [Candidatus Coatesbacteria bacterium]|nr:hypothetical protein [Candidatus Coatesbacteria bacterium]